MKWARMCSAALLVVLFAGCDSLTELTELEVINENNPERERALAEAGDIVSLISSGYVTAFDGQNDYYSTAFMLSAAADETTISWGNCGLQQLSSEPRVEWPNESSWRYPYHEDPWYDNYAALSSVYDALLAIATDEALCGEIDCSRAIAFGKFVQGYAHAGIASQFDSAFVLDETVDLEADVIPLQPYPNVMAKAIEYYNAAITEATGKGWSLELGWMNGNAFSAADFVKVVNSYKVRALTQVARTPAERDNVAWGQVITAVNQGITEDFFMDGDGNYLWDPDLITYGARGGTTWQRADYKTIGWAELDAGETNYQGWLDTPVDLRDDIELNTPDLRIMPPGDPRGDGLDFEYRGLASFDPLRGTYHHSSYAHYRYADYPSSGYEAWFPVILTEEMQLLKAEGLLQTGGSLQDVCDIINATRVTRGGLPAAVPGDGADAIMDMLIYEYRIENFGFCAGCAFYARRGWGPFAKTGPAHHQGPVEGTMMHYAIPGAELEILQKLIYSYGGVGNEGTALSPSAGPGVGNRGGTMIPARALYAFNGIEGGAAEKIAYLRRNEKAAGALEMLTHH